MVMVALFYMHTNEIKNAITHYHRSANGTLTEVERVATGGKGSGTFKPISGRERLPNSLEGAGSVILSADRKFLFVTNGGDNSVSSFAVGDHGKLKLIDTKPTGNAIEGKSGTAKSLVYSPSKGMLYVVYSFGPDHVRLMSVSSDGMLTPRVSMWILFPRGTFIWKRTCGTIAGLNDQTGIARREVDRRGRRGAAAEKLRGFRFSFCFNHQ